jgi:hypothetical protein
MGLEADLSTKCPIDAPRIKPHACPTVRIKPSESHLSDPDKEKWSRWKFVD